MPSSRQANSCDEKVFFSVNINSLNQEQVEVLPLEIIPMLTVPLILKWMLNHNKGEWLPLAILIAW